METPKATEVKLPCPDPEGCKWFIKANKPAEQNVDILEKLRRECPHGLAARHDANTFYPDCKICLINEVRKQARQLEQALKQKGKE